MYIIAAFRSRNSSIKLYNLLLSRGVYAEIVNTPGEAYVGCGLSVKFEYCCLEKVRSAVLECKPPAFAGYFSLTRDEYGRQTVKSL